MLALPEPGQRFMKSGSEFEIITVTNDLFSYASVNGGRHTNIDMYQFLTFLESDDFEYIGGEPSNERLFVQYSKIDQETMLRRFKYIDYVSKRTTAVRSIAKAVPFLREKAKADNEAQPSFGDFARWVRTYIESGYNIFSLLPKNNKKGNYKSRIPDAVKDIMTNQIKTTYLTIQRLSVTHTYDKVIEDLKKLHQENNCEKSGYYPTIKSLYRMIQNEYSPYTVAAARHGRKYAQRHFRASGEQQTATRILEIVEADGQISDVIIIDEITGQVIGRPYLTAIIDRYSGCIIATEITFIPFSTATVLNALKGALNEDNELPGGKIETLITDNGSDYLSNGLKNACSNLKIDLEYLPPGTPNGKPYIEVFFNILNKQLIHKLPGSTFSSPDDRGLYKSEECAQITLSRLKTLIKGYLDKVYHPHTAKGSSSSRMERWNTSLRDNGTVTYGAKNLEMIARTVLNKTIVNGRITHLGMHWYSHKLREIELILEGKTSLISNSNTSKASKGNRSNAQVDIYLDEFDLSKIYVLNPTSKNKEMIQADSTLKNYSKNLTLYEHKKVRAANKIDKSKKKWDEIELCLQRAKFWREVECGEGYSNKQVARITNGDPIDVIMSQMTGNIIESPEELSNDTLAEQVIAEHIPDSAATSLSTHQSLPTLDDVVEDDLEFRKSGDIK